MTSASIRSLELSAQQDPTEPSIYFHLGMAYMRGK
jgi:hypothetical protein